MEGLQQVALTLLAIVALVLVLVVVVIYITYLERKVISYMQCRISPITESGLLVLCNLSRICSSS